MDSKEFSELHQLINKIESQEECHKVWKIVKTKFDQLASLQALNFYKGQRVEFNDNKGAGTVIQGTVEKVNRKTIAVRSDLGQRWRVAPSLLRPETPKTEEA